MTCPDDQRLVLYADAATETSDPQVCEHLRSCAVCADRVDQVRTALTDWRTADLCITDNFDADYFTGLAEDIEQALDHIDSASSTPVVLGPAPWWRRPASLAAAIAALLLLSVGLLRSPTQSPLVARDTAPQGEDEQSLEEMARELGRSLLSSTSEADDSLEDEEGTSFFAAWTAEPMELGDDLPPMPLTTTLADEFDLLDSEQVRSLITRL